MNNKRLIFILLLSACTMLTVAAERAVVDRIVYELNLMNLSAKVLNFQTSLSEPCDVVIPSTIIYKNDRYVVTELSEESMFSNEKLRYDYREARLNIEHISLPNTLKVIHNGAFDGMRRLKDLIIPASVELFTHIYYEEEPYGTNLLLESYSIWGDKIYFPRLESIQVLGTPTIDYNYEKITVASENYATMVGKAIAGIGTPYASIYCPNLKSFSMPKAEEAIEETRKNQALCSQYNLDLETFCEELNSKLRENIFYDGSKLTFNPIQLNNDKGVIADHYRVKKEELTREYNTLNNGGMESNLKITNPYKYIHCYQVAYPETKNLVDSIRLEYRCYSYLYIEIINALDGKPITSTPCREKYYVPAVARLFKDKAEIDERYNRAHSEADFENEIEERQNCKNKLYSFEDELQRNNKVKLQGMSCAGEGFAQFCMQQISYFKSHYYYDNAINIVLSFNVKAKAEYEKNGQYFVNKKNFFEAYISSEYKTILKNIKSK